MSAKPFAEVLDGARLYLRESVMVADPSTRKASVRVRSFRRWFLRPVARCAGGARRTS